MTSSNFVKCALLGGALGAVLLGCPPTPPATGDSGIDAGDCAGTIGCECRDGACTTGECVDGACTDCRRGEAACICRSNGTCSAGLRCSAGKCATCPAGELSCACGAGDTCGTGLVCSSGVCVQSTCVPGAESCPCRASAPTCDGTGYCDSNNLCRACSDDVVGCPCTNGACTGQAVCDATSMRCRAPLSCAALVSAGTCAANQACVEATNGADATCTPAACVTGFKWNGTACVSCVSNNCEMEPTCSTDGGPDMCSMINRACTQQGQVASCGACLPGYTVDGNNCVRVPTCGNTTCAIDQFCERSTGTCQSVCPSGQARNPTPTSTCTACTVTCTPSASLSGRVWPIRYQGACICETLDGYYWRPGASAEAAACDADNDGWVVDEADFDSVRNSEPLRENARCTIRQVERVRLVDEYGQSVDVLSCTSDLQKASLQLPDGGLLNGGTVGLRADGGLAPLADGGSPCTPLPIRLLETARNDGARFQTERPPTYPDDGTAPGRLIDPSEVNSITKACAGLISDFNDNDDPDIDEIQGKQLSTTVFAPDRLRLHQFAYFMELATSYVQGDTLVIQERSRCSPDFPLRYARNASPTNPVDLYDAGLPSTYWRNCTRSRDPGFTPDMNSAVPGMDFGRWACDTTSGTCPELLKLTQPHPTIAVPNPTIQNFRGHGLCELNGAPPADGRWRGMMHHSQFKCVNVSDTGTKPTDRPPGAFAALEAADGGASGANDRLVFNECQARACTGSTPDATCTRSPGPVGSGPQTRVPIIDCQPLPAVSTVAGVGFAAVGYRPYRNTGMRWEPPTDAGISYPPSSDNYGMATEYRGGCMNEDSEPSPYLCAYPEFSLSKTTADGTFGRYSCYGKGSNFLWCGTPCNPKLSTLRWGPNSNNSVLRNP